VIPKKPIATVNDIEEADKNVWLELILVAAKLSQGIWFFTKQGYRA